MKTGKTVDEEGMIKTLKAKAPFYLRTGNAGLQMATESHIVVYTATYADNSLYLFIYLFIEQNIKMIYFIRICQTFPP